MASPERSIVRLGAGWGQRRIQEAFSSTPPFSKRGSAARFRIEAMSLQHPGPSDIAREVLPEDRTLVLQPASEMYPALDLTTEPVGVALVQAIPLDLMLKHHFVPV